MSNFENLEPVLGRNPKSVSISNSEIQTFKGCRRRWMLGTYYGLQPNDLVMTGPLPLGTRIHNALEIFYRDGENPVDVYNRFLRVDADLFAKSNEATDETKIKKFNSEAELGRRMIEGYLEWLDEDNRDADIEYVSQEEKLDYRLNDFDPRVELIAKIDARVKRRSDGTRALMDHKALHVDQMVLTPTGYSRIGDVSVGDVLLAPDGSKTTITGVYPQGVVHLNKVKLKDNSSVLACDEHNWFVKDKNRAEFEVLTTEQIASNLWSGSNLRYSIPVVGNIEFDRRDTPIDPYTLGCILGDGGISDNAINFTSKDSEIPDLIQESAGESVIVRNAPWHKTAYTLFDKFIEQVVNEDGHVVKKYPLKESLIELGLWGNKSQSKFVPDIYKNNSSDVRLEVLRGIMDTDGFVRN